MFTVEDLLNDDGTELTINSSALFEEIKRYNPKSISDFADVIGGFLRNAKQKDFNIFVEKLKTTYDQQNKIYEYEKKQIEKANQLLEENAK